MSPVRWKTRTTPSDRVLGWLLSLLGVLLIAREVLRLGDQAEAFAAWWLALAAAVAMLVVILAIGGLALPPRALRILWWTAAAGGTVVQALPFVAYEGSAPDTGFLVIWGFQPVTCLYFVLLVRAAIAVGLMAASALLPPVSAFLLLGYVPRQVVEGAAIYLAAVALIVLLVGLRARLAELSEVERRAKIAEQDMIVAEEQLRAQRDLARLLHDEVLSTLTAAMRLKGDPPPVLRAEASHALAALKADQFDDEDQSADAAHVVESLVDAVRASAPDAVITVTTRPGVIPDSVVDAARGAVSEAARNSMRHAPSAHRRAAIEVSGEQLRIVFADDGPGFAIDDVPPERLGVRESILHRMSDIGGGHASVTADAAGTTVEMSWRR